MSHLLEAVMDSYTTKPFEVEKLLRTIANEIMRKVA